MFCFYVHLFTPTVSNWIIFSTNKIKHTNLYYVPELENLPLLCTLAGESTSIVYLSWRIYQYGLPASGRIYPFFVPASGRIDLFYIPAPENLLLHHLATPFIFKLIEKDWKQTRRHVYSIIKWKRNHREI